MALDIATNLGIHPLRAYPDLIFSGQDLPDTDSVESETVLLGRTQHGLEVVVTAETEITVIASTDLTINYLHGDLAGSPTAIELYTVTGEVGNTVIAAGTELARFVPPVGEVDSYAQLQIVTTGTSTGSVTAYAELINR